MRFGQTVQSARSAESHRATERALHVIGEPLQFGTAAGQHHLPPNGAGKTKVLERFGHLSDQMVEPLADDRDQLRARDPPGLARIVLR